MKPLVELMHSSPRYSKVFHWGKLLSITGLAQLLVQGLGFICGILVIRLLPVNEYAWYTLANTMLGTMSVLADGGISAGVMSQGGKVWLDKEKLGSVLATGLDLRRKFAIGSLLIAIPILIYLLSTHGAGWLTITLIILSLVPAFFAALSDSVLEIVPKLHQDIIILQKNQLAVSVARLILSGLFLFIFPFTFIALIAAGIPRIYGNIKLKKITHNFTDHLQKPDPSVQTKILGLVKRTLPGSIYYCISGQITIWLISIFGSTASVAQVGALGRVAMVLTIFSSIFSTLIIPRFARLPIHPQLLLKRFLQIQIGLMIFGVLLIFLIYTIYRQALWILGPNYLNLKNELILSFSGSYIGLIAGTLFSLNSSRGWTIHPMIFIPLDLLVILIGILMIDISTLTGLFKFNILVMSTEVIAYFSYGLIRILKTSDLQ
jgi:O-antigen/teichoic acid export membrane protein